ncbi:MAG: hypothetical protein P8090_09125 [Gammaproteobacteria bacterium]
MPTNPAPPRWDDSDPIDAAEDEADLVPGPELAQRQGAARRRLEEIWESRRLQGVLRDVYDEP